MRILTNRGSQRKGADGEKEVVRILQEHGLEAERNCQRWTGGKENPDVSVVVSGQKVHLEVKRRERASFYDAINQAVSDASADSFPCVCYRANRKPWLVIARLEDVLSLLQKGLSEPLKIGE